MTYSQDRVFSTKGNTWVVAASALSVFPSYESCVVMGLATQAIPIIGAIHSAWSAASTDMSKACTAGLVLSATHSSPKGALIANCSRHRQVMTFQAF